MALSTVSILGPLTTMQMPTLIVTVISIAHRWIPIFNTSLSEVFVILLISTLKTFLSISLKHNSFTSHLSFKWTGLSSAYLISLLCLSITSLCWSPLISQSWIFFVSRQTFPHSSSPYFAIRSSNPPRTGMAKSRVGWGFVCFSYSTWWGSTQCHLGAAIFPYYPVCSHSSLLDHCLTVSYLSLFCFPLSGACFACSYTLDLRSPFQFQNLWRSLPSFCPKVSNPPLF